MSFKFDVFVEILNKLEHGERVSIQSLGFLKTL